MTEWTAKRFWTAARVVASAEGFGVELDARPLRTPAKALLTVPSDGLARAIAAEWDAQETVIDPRTMPMTRSANSALDKVHPQIDAVLAELAGYGETDLTCYRAEGPSELVRLQSAAWDPILDWATRTLGASLTPTQGVIARAQPTESLAALNARLAAEDAFGLCALADLVALSGSLLIALATVDGAQPAEALWAASRVDEDWQASQWGEDAEAAAAAAAKRADFLHAAQFHRLSRTGA